MFTAIRFAVILAVSLIPVFGSAQDFSADVVYLPVASSDARFSNTDVIDHNPSKLYVSNGKMRLETHGLIGTILLVNREEESAYAVFPSKKEYEPLAGGLLPFGSTQFLSLWSSGKVPAPAPSCAIFRKGSKQRIFSPCHRVTVPSNRENRRTPRDSLGDHYGCSFRTQFPVCVWLGRRTSPIKCAITPT